MRTLTIEFGANATGALEYLVRDEYGRGPGPLTFEEALGYVARLTVPAPTGARMPMPPWTIETDEVRLERSEARRERARMHHELRTTLDPDERAFLNAMPF